MIAVPPAFVPANSLKKQALPHLEPAALMELLVLWGLGVELVAPVF